MAMTIDHDALMADVTVSAAKNVASKVEALQEASRVLFSVELDQDAWHYMLTIDGFGSIEKLDPIALVSLIEAFLEETHHRSG
jgi:hypothetical protein